MSMRENHFGLLNISTKNYFERAVFTCTFFAFLGTRSKALLTAAYISSWGFPQIKYLLRNNNQTKSSGFYEQE